MTDGPILTRKEIVNTLMNELSLSKEEVRDLLRAIIETAKNAIIQTDKLLIPGFGAFYSYMTKARVGRNPKTGEEAPISIRRTVKLRPSISLRARVNKGRR